MSRGRNVVNALIAVDKPSGMTSHDVVGAVRSSVGQRRVGHAGTLDPLATGVLVLGLGQATKLLGLLTLDRKSYRTTITFGAETTTDDSEGEVTRTSVVSSDAFDVKVASAYIESLVGEFDQLPPAYSAISVGGTRAYDIARRGDKVALAPRRVTIHSATLVSLEAETSSWTIDFVVSKGTYVRAIARDLGRALGCFAHVSELRRTSSGTISLDDCIALDEVSVRGAEAVLEWAIDPVSALGLASRPLEARELRDVVCGRPITRKSSLNERVCLTWDGGLVGIWEPKGDKLVCSVNFPEAIVGVV